MKPAVVIQTVIVSLMFALISAAGTGSLAKELWVILVIGIGSAMIGSHLGRYRHPGRSGAVLAGYCGDHIGGFVGPIVILNLIDRQSATSLSLAELPLALSVAVVVGGFSGGIAGRIVNNLMSQMSEKASLIAKYDTTEAFLSRRFGGVSRLTWQDGIVIGLGGLLGGELGSLLAPALNTDLFFSQLAGNVLGIALAVVLRKRVGAVFSKVGNIEGMVSSGLIPRTELRKSTEGQWVAGVAAGISQRYEISVILLRARFVIFTPFLGFGFAAYAVGWFLMSDESEHAGYQTKFHKLIWLVDAEFQWKVLAAGLPIGVIIAMFGVVSLPSISVEWATFGIVTIPWSRELESVVLIGMGALIFSGAMYTGYKSHWLEEPVTPLTRFVGIPSLLLSTIGILIVVGVVALWIFFVTVIIMFMILMFKVMFTSDDKEKKEN